MTAKNKNLKLYKKYNKFCCNNQGNIMDNNICLNEFRDFFLLSGRYIY